MPNNWGGRIYGHPVLPGLNNDTYFDALLEFGFINSSSANFAGGSFYDVSFVDMYVADVRATDASLHGAGSSFQL